MSGVCSDDLTPHRRRYSWQTSHKTVEFLFCGNYFLPVKASLREGKVPKTHLKKNVKTEKDGKTYSFSSPAYTDARVSVW